MLRNPLTNLLLLLVAFPCTTTVIAQGNVQKQKIALSSRNGQFLQCTCSTGGDGTTHANNQHINKEEAWWLWTVGNPNSHQVALGNYRNGYYLWRHPGGANNHRVRVIHDIGPASTWTMVSGADYGLPADHIALRAVDGAYLKARDGGGHANAEGENGEVYVDMGGPTKDPNWVGWWRMGEVNFDPTDGPNTFTSIGDGMYVGIKWVGNAIAYAFTGPATGGVQTASTALKCDSKGSTTSQVTSNSLGGFVTATNQADPRIPQKMVSFSNQASALTIASSISQACAAVSGTCRASGAFVTQCKNPQISWSLNGATSVVTDPGH